jgi:hypothetical protein
VKVEEALLANPKLAMSVFSTLKTQNLTGRVPTLAEWHEAFLTLRAMSVFSTLKHKT